MPRRHSAKAQATAPASPGRIRAVKWDQLNGASRERLRSIVRGLDDKQASRTLPSGWTVAATLAHLAFWDRFGLARWERFLSSGARPQGLGEASDLINAAGLPLWRALRPHDAIREALDAADAVDQLIAKLPREVADDMQRSGWERMLDRSPHRNEHLDDIEASLQQS